MSSENREFQGKARAMRPSGRPARCFHAAAALLCLMLPAVGCGGSAVPDRPRLDASRTGTGGSGGSSAQDGPGGTGGSATPADAGETDGAAIVQTDDASATDGPAADVTPADASPDLGPKPANCGDKKLDPGEDCDDGPLNAASAYGPGKCTDRCKTAPFCGDGKEFRGEQCDDGAKNGNGRETYSRTPPPPNVGRICNAECRVVHFCGDRSTEADQGERCDNGPMNAASAYGRNACTDKCQVAPFCGDRRIDAAHGEQCDDGPDNGKAAAPGRPGCSNDCKVVAPVATCGDHHVDPGEECDEGGNNSRDGAEYSATPPASGQVPCNAQCKLIHFCGDGRTDQGREQCDEGAMNASNDGDYSPIAPPAGHKACNRACRLMHFCGDRMVDAGKEQCDLGADNGKAPAAGATGCSLQCTPIVAPPVASPCGNGMPDQGEECDRGAANVKSGDVYARTPPTSGQPDCNQNCKLIHFCGDDDVQADQGEACDNGKGNSDTAADGCTTECKQPACGDGKKQDGEQCDDRERNVAITYSPVPPEGADHFCSRQTCKFVPFCGDGLVSNGEQCDPKAAGMATSCDPLTCKPKPGGGAR
jgi:hypothetical protein